MSHLGFVQTHSFSEAALSLEQERYPVLIFSHGDGGNRNQNTFQVEELASHGYIVIGIEYTYNAVATVFPDGRTVDYLTENAPDTNAEFDERMSIWTADASFVLDQLEEPREERTVVSRISLTWSESACSDIRTEEPRHSGCWRKTSG